MALRSPMSSSSSSAKKRLMESIRYFSVFVSILIVISLLNDSPLACVTVSFNAWFCAPV